MLSSQAIMAQATSAAITLEQVTRTYSSGQRFFGTGRRTITALDRIDLSIGKGEIFGLVGESGSGKTTIARLIVRLEKPDRGVVRIDGTNVNTLRGPDLLGFRRRVQMIFQDPYQSLNPYLSVHSIINEPLEIHKSQSRQARRAKVAQTLAMVGLDTSGDMAHRYPHQLSGGQRQRVAIARAMVLDPEVLLADEPTSMLDASIAIQIYQILTDIQKSRQVTMVFITHSLAAAHYLCDRIAVIYRGHIVETGPAKAVISAPRHPYTQALLDALPRFGNGAADHRFNTLRYPERPDERSEGCPFYSRCLRSDDALCPRQRPHMRPSDDLHQAACFFA